MSRRRRRHAEPENHERWLVSYADFITLLFAFFVVLFASGQTDQGRAKEMSESMKEAMRDENKYMKAVVDAVVKGSKSGEKQKKAVPALPVAAPKAGELSDIMKQLLGDLQGEIASGQMQVSLEPRGLVISLKQATFFPSGEDAIARETYASLGKLSSVIKPLPNAIRLEGHTDAIPIRTTRFQSNWELSASRSIAVLTVLANEFQVPTSRMAVVGYAETVPISSNDTAEGRSRNRRVDVVLLNEKARQVDAGASTPRK